MRQNTSTQLTVAAFVQLKIDAELVFAVANKVGVTNNVKEARYT